MVREVQKWSGICIQDFYHHQKLISQLEINMHHLCGAMQYWQATCNVNVIKEEQISISISISFSTAQIRVSYGYGVWASHIKLCSP